MILSCNKHRGTAVIVDHSVHFGHYDVIITDSQSTNTPCFVSLPSSSHEPNILLKGSYR